MKVINGITLFHGGELSNFSAANFVINGIQFNRSEQYYAYQKAIHFNDPNIADAILKTTFPGHQKKLGRSIETFKAKEWCKVMCTHMYDACYAKFSQNEKLKQILLNTKDTILAEASPYDNIWGIGLPQDDPRAWSKSTWRGSNLLGEVLMQVRHDIIVEDTNNITF